MPTSFPIEAARFGLAYERLRLEAASLNLALANAPLGPGESAALRTVSVAGGGFAQGLGLPVVTSQPEATATSRIVNDPAHHLADAEGNVFYRNVEPSREMATLVSATRAYEANVRAFNAIHQMALKSLEIGGRR
jgi:flagellar basal-body rod protein FlgC